MTPQDILGTSTRKVVGSNPAPAPTTEKAPIRVLFCCAEAEFVHTQCAPGI